MFTNLLVKDIEDKISTLKSRDILKLECIVCGYEYERPKNRIQASLRNNKKPLFCSRECYSSVGNKVFKIPILPCSNCGELTFHNQKFCNRSCAAFFNNKERFPHKFCLNCNDRISTDQTYCSSKCFNDYEFNQRLESWKTGTESIFSNILLRKFLTAEFGYKCSKCGISDWNNEKISLEVEHISGQCLDSSYENVCLLCPNCHSQTSTYRAKNKGKSQRAYRKKK